MSWHCVSQLGLCLEPESIKQREKNVNKNDFLMFGSIIENINENQI